MEVLKLLKRFFPMNTKPWMMVAPLALLAACGTQSDKAVREDAQKHALVSNQGESIPPGKCRIVGTIIAIDSTLEGNGPCSKAPCRALVRVDSILGYGSAFRNPLPLHGQVSVRFAWTLAPTTEDLFPNMTDRLPGLVTGSTFRSDVESNVEMNSAGGRGWYVVKTYKRLN